MTPKSVVLFEDPGFRNLLPLVYWRTVSELRLGACSLFDRWQRSGRPISGLWTRDWMADVAAIRSALPVNAPIQAGTLLINSRWLPGKSLADPNGTTSSLPPLLRGDQGGFARTDDPPASHLPPLLRGDQGGFVARIGPDIAYIVCDEQLAARLTSKILLDPAATETVLKNVRSTTAPGYMLRYPWEFVAQNAAQLHTDLATGPFHQRGEVHPTAVLHHPEHIRIDENARVEALAVLDASDGPICIEGGAVIRAHAFVCGPAFIGRGAIVNPHAYLHGGCSIGPVCKVGGEVDACIFAGYSNKQHEGFLGHAYVGAWVNLGAGTTNSDLKNTYGTVRCAPLGGEAIDTGQRFFGAIIADHVKTAIGTRIPTGGCISFASNCASSRLLPKFVPSFTWLTDDGSAPAKPEALLATAKTVIDRRKQTMTGAEQALFVGLASMAKGFERTAGPA